MARLPSGSDAGASPRRPPKTSTSIPRPSPRLAGALDEDENVDILASALGSILLLTDRRLIVLRQGAEFRPRTGIQAFARDRDLEVRIAPTIKQVTVASSGRAISVFIRREQLADVESLVAERRRRIYAA